MVSEYPASWSALKQPWERRDLLVYLRDLTSPDPVQLWVDQRAEGSVAGFDEIVHFFFDDHLFDEAGIGFSLFDVTEVGLIQAIKAPLDQIIDDLPAGTDEESAGHPSWELVRSAAQSALTQMRDR